MGDAASEYLASVLAHDPAESPGEILRLRRGFLGRPPATRDAAAGTTGAAGGPRAAPPEREREARLTTRKWLAAARRARSESRATRVKVQQQESKSTSVWVWIAAGVFVCRLLGLLMKDR